MNTRNVQREEEKAEVLLPLINALASLAFMIDLVQKAYERKIEETSPNSPHLNRLLLDLLLTCCCKRRVRSHAWHTSQKRKKIRPPNDAFNYGPKLSFECILIEFSTLWQHITKMHHTHVEIQTIQTAGLIPDGG